MTLLGSEILTQSYPAMPGSVPIARHELVAYAIRVGADGEQAQAIRLAVSEALTNVVMHAYRGGGEGCIDVTASLAGGELWVLIADDGEGLQPRSQSPGLGVGLALIAQSCDALTIMNRAGGGTEIRMCFNLNGEEPARAPQERGSRSSASAPASPRFSTTT